MDKEKKNIIAPKFRFPEFKNTGQWNENTLGNTSLFLKGKGISKSDINLNGSLPCIRYGELYTHYTEIIDSTFSFTSLFPEDLVLSEPMDVIIPSSGETREDIATAACVIKEGIALGGDLNIIRSQIDGIFLSYYLTHVRKKAITKLAQGDAVVHLYGNQLKALSINFPKLKEEQQKIASCLSSLDDLITLHAQKLEALKAHKQGLMQQLFTAEGEKEPRLRFAEFKGCGEWESHALSEFISSLDAGVSVNSGDRPATEKELGILKTSCVSNGVFEPLENKVVAEELEVRRLRESVSGNTIIISRMNTPALVGANAYIEIDINNIFLPDRLWAAKPKSHANMRFVAQILGSAQGRKALTELATGTSDSMKNISKSDVLDMKILTPETQEQHKIADCLSSLGMLITEQIKKIEQLKSHKKGLIQGLFPIFNEVNT